MAKGGVMVAHNILLLSYASLMLAILWITFRSYRGWRIGRWCRLFSCRFSKRIYITVRRTTLRIHRLWLGC